MKFYKETNFQETPIGKIPKDWEVMRATDVAEYINGYPFSPKDWKTSGIPIIRIQNLNDPNAEFNFFDGEIDEIYKVKNGDLLLSWSASIGVYIWKRGDAVLNQHIFKVIPKPKVNKLFLYYALFLAIEQLKRRVHGSTMKHFRRGELETTFLPFPPLGEQQKITEILSIVDEAIQKTDEITAKGERLKKALMNELLTGRIRVREENGRLSFHRETELQETEVGEIPRGWHVVKLGELIEMNHGERPEVILHEGDVPIYGGGGLYGFTNTYLVDKPYVLILARVGKGSVGKVYLARGRVWVTDNAIYGYSKDPNGITTVYAYYWLLFDKTWIEKYVRRSAGGYAIITLNSLNNLKLPLPPLNEQKGITKIISTIDKAVDLHYKGKERLERLKRGLMDLLLTGKVRVVDGDVGS